MVIVNIMRIMLITGYIFLSSCCGLIAVDVESSLENLKESGADWGIWIDNGLVNPGESVRMTVSVPFNTPSTNLPAVLEVHPRYLEDTQAGVENVNLNWERIPAKNQWQARVHYRPQEAGNYYAAIHFCGHELFSYFAAWKTGITAVNFWVDMPVEYHDAGNLKDLYLPEVKSGHLPFDYELVLAGELVFQPDWKPRELFCRAQVEAGAEVVPFLDGGYFHKLAPEFTQRFEEITNTMPGWRGERVVQRRLRRFTVSGSCPTPPSIL